VCRVQQSSQRRSAAVIQGKTDELLCYMLQERVSAKGVQHHSPGREAREESESDYEEPHRGETPLL